MRAWLAMGLVLVAGCYGGDETFDDGFGADDVAVGVEESVREDSQALTSAALMDRRFDQVTWLTTHNAFANYGDARWSAPNQSKSIRSQLDGGVRALMLDVHYWDPPSWLCWVSFGADCYSKGVYLCHGECGTFAGVTYALPRQSFSGALKTVTDFLRSNPTEIVTLFLEDYVSPSQLRTELDKVPGLSNFVFNPEAWPVKTRGWPTLRDMVASNKRLVIFTDRSENRGVYGIALGRDYTVENYWSIGDLGNDYTCRTRWSTVPLNKAESGWNRLFVMNHFRNVSTVINGAIDNTYDNLQTRVEDYCLPAAGKLPNFVSVDFFEVPGNAPRSYVEYLNTVR